uniref:Shikimate O-hydroxycinnamoyltransferase n=1 Tax=Salix viminalis TaxID=40686 RepID=A0A6N2L7W2_SALVM
MHEHWFSKMDAQFPSNSPGGGDTMKINTKESIIVRPSQEDIPQQRLWLSNMDLLHPRYYLPTVYLYKPNGSSDFFEAEVLKEALRKVLVPFYPVAGRLARDENGRVEINCNGEGVLLVVADTDSTTEELGEFMPSMKLRQLIPTVDTNLQDISRNPLLLLQVTSFKCGGVCLGVGWHHTLADGTGALHFINSWATLARGLPITIPPFLDRTILRGRVAPKSIFHHVEYDPPPTMNTDLTKNPEPQSLTNLKITLEQIDSLKAKASNVGSETKYTTYEILTAHIWRSVSKARNFQSNDQKTKLRIAVDGRSRLDPPLQSSYFGNVIFTASPVALSGDLLSESFRCTVERIHREIKKMDAEYLRSALDYLEEVGDVNSIPRGSITCACPNLNIVSWMRLPIYKVDFGWGAPLLLRPATMFEGGGDTMKINTKESIIVRPSQDIPQQRLWVSNMDLLHPRYYLPTVYLYKPNGSSDFFEAEVIKEALRKVLVPFYPVAGRLARDENGRIEINCNGEGVLLVVADTDSTTEELGEFMPSMKLRQLIPTVDTNLEDISRNPLLLLQVTSFKCGGVCLGVGWHHTLADGTGALHFINSWATLARGLSITIPPLLDRTILRGRVAPKPIFHHVEFDPPPTMNTDHLTKNTKPQSLANLKITLEQINSLKAKVSNVGSETMYTTYEILTAHIWRSVSKARNFHNNDQKTKLQIAVDGRSRLNPPLQSIYFGNVIFIASPVALSGDLLSESLRCTVERIHREIKKMDDEYLRSALDYLEEVGDVNSIPRGSITCACPNLNIVSWMRLPFYKADFGWGGGDTMKINTKESIIVRPSQEDIPQQRLWLSNMDLMYPRYYCTSTSRMAPPIFEKLEALRKVLVPFYPVAGRLARDENGRIEINCNGEGVLFVVADTESTTEELGEFMPSMKFRQLIPTVDTNLEDISLCLGVGWHHTLADGTGALHFINSWATLARGLPITITPPFLDRTILRGRVAPKSIFHHSNDQKTKLRLPVDGRSRLNPPLQSTYFGNVIFEASVVALSCDLLSESFSIPRGSIICACPNLSVNSWMRLPFFKADFGWGAPLLIRPATMVEGKGHIHPNLANDGICLGVGWHHTLADGTGALHFINSWATLARGLSITIPPLLDRTILRGAPWKEFIER